MTLSASVREIEILVLSFHPIIAIETVEEERVETLLKVASQRMKMSLFEWTIVRGLIPAPGTVYSPATQYAPPGANEPVGFERTTEPLDLLDYIQNREPQSLYLLKDFAKHLGEPEVVRKLRDVARLFSLNRSALAITGDSIELPREISHDTVYYDLGFPGQDELHQTLLQTVRSLKVRNRIEVKLTKPEIRDFVRALSGMTLNQARQVIAQAAIEDGQLDAEDIEHILKRKAQIIREGGLLEYFPVEANGAELGGFQGLKNWLARAKVGFSDRARQFNLTPPKGILIVGIQGCGKSLAAKAIAREWKLPLLKLDAGRLYDKYVGQSEKNFHKATTLAESMAPTVLWIDEIEKSFGHSGGDSDGGLSRRLFGSFLTWLQEKSQQVFVVATANDISQIPPELLRKGRFDELFFVDLPNAKERDDILRVHLNLRNQNPDLFDFPVLVEATEGFSGAEIEQVTIASLYRSLWADKSLDTELMLAEVRSTVPLSVARREDVQRLRAIAQERFVSVR